MSKREHLELLKQDVEAWNEWRSENMDLKPDLRRANLENKDLSGANLTGARLDKARLGYANLSGADLKGAELHLADLRLTDFENADLSRTSLLEANLYGTNLRGAQLKGSNLAHARLYALTLGGTNFFDAHLAKTSFHNVDLSRAIGLASCLHSGPSSVDFETLAQSEDVPLAFWRGCGLPDQLIDYMPSLTGAAIQFYSCFISYSSKDHEFADRLYADLQNKGVRCWFAPHDLPIGTKTWDGIDEAIRTRDKVLLILSEGAIASDWVEDEVTAAFAEERRRDKIVLFPVSIDGAVMNTDEPWASKLRDNRNIGDFSQWKDHDAYKATLDRVLRDLNAKR